MHDSDCTLSQEADGQKPSLSITAAPGRYGQNVRAEYAGRFLEGDTMLAPVRLVLRRIPFEFHKL